MRKAPALALLLCLLSCASLLPAADYRITNYRMDVDVDLANRYQVSQVMDFLFTSPRHGYYQEIPVRFGRKRVKLENLVSSDPLKVEESNPNWKTFRVGDAESTVVGPHRYTLSYTYDVGEGTSREYDEFYFDLLGTAWECDVDAFSFSVRFPSPIDPEMVWVTYGRQGSEKTMRPTLSGDRKTVSATVRNLGRGRGLTLRVQMEKGYFSAVVPKANYSLLILALALLLGVAALCASLVIYSRYGKDKMLVPVVRYTPPEGFSPLLVGYLADGSVDPKDITSLLFYWADKGYLSIREGKKKEYTFVKLKDMGQDVPAHEKFLFDAFFECGGRSGVTCNDLASSAFSRKIEKAKTMVEKYFKGERDLKDQMAESKRTLVYLLSLAPMLVATVGVSISGFASSLFLFPVLGVGNMFLTNLFFSLAENHHREMRKKSARILSFLTLLVVNALFFFHCFSHAYRELGATGMEASLAGISIICVPAIIACVGVVTAKRSDYGTRMLEETLGYREFISKVEIDKLKMMIDEDPEIFYHVLGYAIVLGLENKWARKFEGLGMEQPSWYSGSHDGLFNYWMFSAMTRDIQTSVHENIYHEASGHSRGGGAVHSLSRSGGFSGGGFGGGGGGAW